MSNRHIIKTATAMSALTLAANAAALVLAVENAAPRLVIGLVAAAALGALLAVSILALYWRRNRSAAAEVNSIVLAPAEAEAAAGGRARMSHRLAPAALEPRPPSGGNVVRFPRPKRTPE